MFASIYEDLKQEFRYGNAVSRLIIINTAVFAITVIISLVFTGIYGQTNSLGFTQLIRKLSVEAHLPTLLWQPWALLTSMFLHVNLFHIVFNLIGLYWFGRIVGDLLGNERIVPLYLLSGLSGWVVFVLSANLLNNYYHGAGTAHYAYGASGAVMGIMVASAVTHPDYLMRLILVGNVKLKFVVGVILLIDLLSIAQLSNSGGHFAHLGGAAFGWLFVTQLRAGRDLGAPVNQLLNNIKNLFTRRSKPIVIGQRPARQRTGVKVSSKGAQTRYQAELSHQEQLDAILDKIKQKGYDSLSHVEKEFLFNASKNEE